MVDLVPISQPPLSYTTMRPDEYTGGLQVTRPTDDGCEPVDGQDIIKCGVNTTLMDCCRGIINDINFSDLSDYFCLG